MDKLDEVLDKVVSWGAVLGIGAALLVAIQFLSGCTLAVHSDAARFGRVEAALDGKAETAQVDSAFREVGKMLSIDRGDIANLKERMGKLEAPQAEGGNGSK